MTDPRIPHAVSFFINDHVTIGKNVNILPGAVIGFPGAIRNADQMNGRVIIGDNCYIGANAVIAIGHKGDTIIGDNCIVMNHANIGHNCKIADKCEIGAGVMMSGHVEVGYGSKIKIGCVIRNRVKIASGSVVGMGSVVTKDLRVSDSLYFGSPAKFIRKVYE